MAPTESAATIASLFRSNLISRFRRFSASSTIKRPRVNLKNSLLEFQSDMEEHYVESPSDGRTYLSEKSSCWRDTDRTMSLELSRLTGGVASGLVFYSECSTKDARMEVGTYFV